MQAGRAQAERLNEQKCRPSGRGRMGDEKNYKAELMAVKHYNTAIRIATEAGDDATREILTKILRMEEEHVDWANPRLTRSPRWV